MARGLTWFVGRPRRPTPSNNSSNNNNNDPLADQVDADAATSGPDPEEERNAPRRPLPITLPRATLTPAVWWGDDHPPPNFQRLVAGIKGKKLSLSELLVAVNCDHQPPCPGDALLPSRANGTSFTSPAASREQAFAVRIAELDIDNDTAFRVLSRTTRQGVTPPRLAYLRRFWIGLDSMAQYWDPSLDDYRVVTVPAEPEESEPGAAGNGQLSSEATRSVIRYKGRRISNGNDMPDTYRSDTVRALVEGVTSAFNCRVQQPYCARGSETPMLQIGNIELPLRVTGVVYRLPSDRARARDQIVEGPIIGILERPACDFRDLYTGVSQAMSEDDLMREIAAMLFIAQGRRREGKTFVSPGEGKWYTTRPRWGGGPGGKLPMLQRSEDKVAEVRARVHELQDAHEELRRQLSQLDPNSEEHEATMNRATELADAHAEAKKEMRERRKELQGAQRVTEKFNDLTPQHGFWEDKKTDYKAIGKQPGSKYDNIFLVSCVIHHVRILKLVVHDAYIDYITTGVLPDPMPAEQDWCRPRLECTDWYDMLDTSTRVRAFKVIWNVMEYMHRENEAPETGEPSNDAADTTTEASSNKEAQT